MYSMPPFIPVLFSDISQLKQPVDIIKFTLHSYMHLPKNINDTFPTEELSFRYDDAENGHNPAMIRDQVRLRLTTNLRKYFPTASVVEVTVETENVADDGRYNVKIDILVVVDEIPYSISQDYEVDTKGNLVYNLTEK